MTGAAIVNGVGLCCSLGKTFAEATSAYAAGDMNFEKSDDVVGPDGLGVRLAPVFGFHEMRDIEVRLQQLFRHALEDLVAQTGPWPEPLALRLLLPAWLADSPIAARLEAWVTGSFADRLASVSFAYSKDGMFLGEVAKGMAAVNEGHASAVVIGVVDSLLSAALLDGLALRNRLFCRLQPYGVTPSEAAVLLRLCLPELSVPAIPTGSVAGVWGGRETRNIEDPDGLIGAGLGRPFAAAFEKRVPDRLLVDLNGERWRSEEIGYAFVQAENLPDDLAADFETPPGATGFCGCATGAVMAALALADAPASWRRLAEPQVNGEEWSIVSASQYDGRRSVALIGRDLAGRNEIEGS
jgi:hypothetical protein